MMKENKELHEQASIGHRGILLAKQAVDAQQAKLGRFANKINNQITMT